MDGVRIGSGRIGREISCLTAIACGFDEAGGHCYYYAHLDRYAERLREGMRVERGNIIAYVGSTGNADPRTPHLHLAVFELGPKREW